MVYDNTWHQSRLPKKRRFPTPIVTLQNFTWTWSKFIVYTVYIYKMWNKGGRKNTTRDIQLRYSLKASTGRRHLLVNINYDPRLKTLKLIKVSAKWHMCQWNTEDVFIKMYIFCIIYCIKWVLIESKGVWTEKECMCLTYHQGMVFLTTSCWSSIF